VQFIGDMLAFHTVRSGVAMAVDGGAGARVVCGNGKSQKKGGGCGVRRQGKDMCKVER
jgi:hypothetical protein